jgi:hypothetical protein
MMRKIGKLLFPRLARDQQSRRINFLALLLVATLIAGGMVVGMIFLMNRR